MSDRSMRKDNLSRTQILHNENPEIFDISPRPGGYLKYLVPPRDQDFSAVGGPIDQEYDPSCRCKNLTCKSSIKGSKGSMQSVTSKSKKSGTNSSHDPTTREFRIAKTLDDSDWATSEKSDVEDEDPNEVETESGVIVADINLLATTITTVLLLASKLPTPIQYLNATEDYLECFKTDDLSTPPNIQGLLNKIALEKGVKGVNWDEGKQGNKPASNVNVITVVRTSTKTPSTAGSK